MNLILLKIFIIMSVLFKGYGSPLITLATEEGYELVNPNDSNKKMSEYISDFMYRYKEEGDDECDIGFEFNDPRLVDHPFLLMGAILKVSWGYLGEEGGMITRLIMIRDYDTKYGKKVIYDIECTDTASKIRTQVNNAADSSSVIEMLKKIKKSGVVIEVENQGWSLDLITKQYTYQGPPGNAHDNSVDHSEVTEFLEQTQPFVFSNKPVTKAVSQVMEYCPDGSWRISGRDNTLKVYNRDTYKAPFRYYTFQGGNGDLISVKIETNKKEEQASRVSAQTYDLSEDSIDHIDIQNSSSHADLSMYKQFSSEYGEYLAQVTKYQEYLDRIRTRELQGNETDFEVMKNLYLEFHDTAFWNDVVTRENRDLRIPSQSLNPLYSPDVKDKVKNLVASLSKDKLLERVQATFIVVGDPLITDSMVVRLGGVAEKHTGRYYIIEAEHTINKQNGYILEEKVLFLPNAETMTQKIKRVVAGDSVIREQAIILTKEYLEAIRDGTITDDYDGLSSYHEDILDLYRVKKETEDE